MIKKVIKVNELDVLVHYMYTDKFQMVDTVRLLYNPRYSIKLLQMPL